MDTSPELDVEKLLTELAELGVGSAILGLRRINIERRKLVDENPGLTPIVDAVLDQIELAAAPLSEIAGAVVAGVGDALPGERGDQLASAGRTIAAMGPELLKMSGLTKRD